MYQDLDKMPKKERVDKDKFVFVEVANGIYFVEESADPYSDKYVSSDKVIRILNDNYTNVTIKNRIGKSFTK